MRKQYDQNRCFRVFVQFSDIRIIGLNGVPCRGHHIHLQNGATVRMHLALHPWVYPYPFSLTELARRSEETFD